MRDWRSGVLALALMAIATMTPARVTNAQAPPPPFFQRGAMGGDKPSPKTVQLEKRAEQLSAQYKKKPTPQVKSRAAQAWYEYGHVRMTDSALSPRQKYRPALKAFRQALKLNPNHKQAKTEKDMIESIYRQMGMPIPG